MEKQIKHEKSSYIVKTLKTEKDRNPLQKT